MTETASNQPVNPTFDAAFRARLRDLFLWRRDVRRFLPDALPGGLLQELLEAAHMAPSVGLSQPWRFVLVESAAKRQLMLENFRMANSQALQAYDGEQAKLYASLKLSGLAEAPVQLAAFCAESTDQGSGLGRATMPETLRYSVVAAIQNLWLAARSHGIGVGWVSILDVERIAQDLEVPTDWRFVAYLCLGYPQEEHLDPELQRHKWESRSPLEDHVAKR